MLYIISKLKIFSGCNNFILTDSNKDSVSIQEVILFKASSFDNQNSWSVQWKLCTY